MTTAPPTYFVALPECWRAELLLSASARRELARQCLGEQEMLRILDWGARAPDPSQPLIVAAFDLSIAELLLKLPAAVRPIGIANPLGRRGWPFGGRRRLLNRARRVPRKWVAPPHPAPALPRDLRSYLQPALGEARRAVAERRPGK